VTVDIEQLLSPADVLVGLRASGKREALEVLAGHMAKKLDLSPDDVLGAILKREGLGSTGIGSGVAIPHARLDAVHRPTGVLARLKRPVEFEAIDGDPVDLVFFLLLRTSPEGEQLNALACVARTLRNDRVCMRARQANDRDAVYAALIAYAEDIRPSP